MSIKDILNKYCDKKSPEHETILEILNVYENFLKDLNVTVLFFNLNKIQTSANNDDINTLIENLTSEMRISMSTTLQDRIQKINEYRNILNNCDVNKDDNDTDDNTESETPQHKCLNEKDEIECLCRSGEINDYLDYINRLDDISKMDYNNVIDTVNSFNTKYSKNVDSDIIQKTLFSIGKTYDNDKSKIINHIKNVCEKVQNKKTETPVEPPPPPPIKQPSNLVYSTIDTSKITNIICKTKDNNIINQAIDHFKTFNFVEIQEWLKNISTEAKDELDKIKDVSDKDKHQTYSKIINELELCVLPEISKVYGPICDTADYDEIESFIQHFNDPDSNTLTNWSVIYLPEVQYELNKIKNSKDSKKYYSQIVDKLKECLPKKVVADIEPPLKIDSDDSVTFVTSEGIVYVYDNGKVMEYEGSFDNIENIREVRLIPSSNDIEIMYKGDFVKLTDANFKQLYPKISEEYEHTNDIATIVKKNAVGILKQVHIIANTMQENGKSDIGSESSMSKVNNTVKKSVQPSDETTITDSSESITADSLNTYQ